MNKNPETKHGSVISDHDKLLKENVRLRAENDYLKKLRALIQKQETLMQMNGECNWIKYLIQIISLNGWQ